MVRAGFFGSAGEVQQRVAWMGALTAPWELVGRPIEKAERLITNLTRLPDSIASAPALSSWRAVLADAA